MMFADTTTSYDHVKIQWGARLDFPNTRQLKLYTHRLFGRYPARSVFLVPQAILEAYRRINPLQSSIRVLDPFMGSGTTAVETVLQGMEPYGVELDPFARLLSEVKVTRYSLRERRQILLCFKTIQEMWTTFPIEESLAPELNNIEYWFDDRTFEELLRLKSTIYYTCSQDPTVLNFFRILLADMIRPCSKAERQTLKPYISKRFPKQPANVNETFENLFNQYWESIQDFSNGHKTKQLIRWLGDDATTFRVNEEIDMAVTSPPYINAVDYVRCIRLESAWVGCGNDQSLAALRKKHVGEALRLHSSHQSDVTQIIEPYLTKIEPLDARRAKLVLNYFHDMYSNLICTWDALRFGGEYHLIVGDSTVRGIDIPTHLLLAYLGQRVGFNWVNYYHYPIKDHRTSIPRKEQGGKIEKEFVITLRKER